MVLGGSYSAIAAGLYFLERELTGSSAETSAGTDPLNLLFIVFMALLISFLAQKFAKRGRRK